MILLRALLAFAAVAFALALPPAASALEECNFNFKVTAESTAFQVLVERAQNEGGIWQPVREAPEDVQKVAKYVGMLQVCFATPDGKPRTVSRQLTTHTIPSPTVTACTATLLPNNQLLTNHHCFYPPEFQALGFKFIQEVRVSFGYLSEDDTSGVKTYRVMNREIDGDEDLDVLLLQIIGGDANADLGGHFPTSMQTEIKPFQELKIIHHPGGAPQRYSSGTCKVHKDQRDLGAEATALRHTCETTVGSSGSLILDGKSLAVVGVHNLGGLNERAKGYNSGHRIAPINKALGLGLEEVQRVAATPKVDPCDPQFTLAKQVNQCAVWDGYFASCSSHSKASEARRLKANACKVDACDGQFEKAKASNSCDSWKSYAQACGNHDGLVVAEMAVELTCKPVAEEKPKQTVTTSKPSAATIEGWLKNGVSASNRQDYAQAATLFRRAADAGDQCGQYRLGNLYQFGRGLTLSKYNAIDWYKKAVAQNGKCSVAAQSALDRLANAATIEGWYRKGVEQYDRKEFAEAVKWYRKAAMQGYARAQHDLGFMYAYGLGVPKSDTEAVKWYSKAAEQGDAFAKIFLGFIYEIGLWGVAQSDTKAVKLYRMAAEQGDADAQLWLGERYADGLGVPKSDTEAVKWYRKAADQGNAYAQRRIDDLTKTTSAPNTSTSKPSAATVENWVRTADAYFKQDKFTEAAFWFRKAALRGNSTAQAYLGYMYANGRGVHKSDAEAVKWYRKAADQGSARAQYSLGYMYAQGRGVAMSNKEAVKWYRKAADQGGADAQNNLGAMYAYGLGVTQSDTEAVKWYRKAADQGDATAQCNLALRTAWGRGTAKDPKSAADWTIKSLQNGGEICTKYMTEPATVREIQKILKQRGLYTGAIDGSNGPSTQAAMRKLLKK